MAYSKELLEHYDNPRNVGSLDKEDKAVGTGLVGAPACGDVMKLQIKVGADGLIEDAKFKTFGCGSAIASSSLAPSGSRASRSTTPSRSRTPKLRSIFRCRR
jgi:nitrogen fixation protein NifU and related proteins